MKDLLIVFVKDLSIVPGNVDQRCDEKWNIFIDYDSRRGPCSSIHHQAAFSEASLINLSHIRRRRTFFRPKH